MKDPSGPIEGDHETAVTRRTVATAPVLQAAIGQERRKSAREAFEIQLANNIHREGKPDSYGWRTNAPSLQTTFDHQTRPLLMESHRMRVDRSTPTRPS